MISTTSKEMFTTGTAIKLDTHGPLPSMTVSTIAVDRDGDRVLPQGGDLTNYLHNPVVLYGHDAKALPIGAATQVVADSTGIKLQWRWLENDPFADRVRNAWEQGIIRAASIGFLPRRSVRNEYGGQDHREWELAEVSLVPVPANPQAVRTLKSLGLWGDDARHQENTVDLAAIFGSSEPAVDWAAINRSVPGHAEVNTTTVEVDRVIAAFAPALRDGIRAGLRLQAQFAVAAAIRKMTGRLD